MEGDKDSRKARLNDPTIALYVNKMLRVQLSSSMSRARDIWRTSNNLSLGAPPKRRCHPPPLHSGKLHLLLSARARPGILPLRPTTGISHITVPVWRKDPLWRIKDRWLASWSGLSRRRWRQSEPGTDRPRLAPRPSKKRVGRGVEHKGIVIKGRLIMDHKEITSKNLRRKQFSQNGPSNPTQKLPMKHLSGAPTGTQALNVSITITRKQIPLNGRNQKTSTERTCTQTGKQRRNRRPRWSIRRLSASV